MCCLLRRETKDGKSQGNKEMKEQDEKRGGWQKTEAEEEEKEKFSFEIQI